MASAFPTSGEAWHRPDQQWPSSESTGSRGNGRGNGRGRGRGGRGGFGAPRGRGRGRGGFHPPGSPGPVEGLGDSAPGTPSLLSRLGPPPGSTVEFPSTSPSPGAEPTTSTSSRGNRSRRRKSSAASNISVASAATSTTKHRNNGPRTPLVVAAKELSPDPSPPHLPALPESAPVAPVLPSIPASQYLTASVSSTLRPSSPHPHPSPRPYTPSGIDWANADDDDDELPDLDDWGLNVKGTSDVVHDSGEVNTTSLEAQLQSFTLEKAPEEAKKPVKTILTAVSNVQTHSVHPPLPDQSHPAALLDHVDPHSSSPLAQVLANRPIHASKLSISTTTDFADIINPTATQAETQGDKRKRNKKRTGSVASVTTDSHPSPISPVDLHASPSADSVPSLIVPNSGQPGGPRTTRTRSARGNTRTTTQNQVNLPDGLPLPVAPPSPTPSNQSRRGSRGTRIAGNHSSPKVKHSSLDGLVSLNESSPLAPSLHPTTTSPSMSNLSMMRPENLPHQQSHIDGPINSSPNGSLLSRMSDPPSEQHRGPPYGSGRGGPHRGRGRDNGPFSNHHSNRGGFDGTSHNQPYQGRGPRKLSNASNQSNSSSSGHRGGKDSVDGSFSRRDEGGQEGRITPDRPSGGMGHGRSQSRPILSQIGLSRLTANLSPPKRGGSTLSTKPTLTGGSSGSASTKSGPLQVGGE